MNGALEKFGCVIKSARMEKQLTQKSLAERLSITPRYLMSIEKGKQVPSCDLFFKIIRALDIPADLTAYAKIIKDPNRALS